MRPLNDEGKSDFGSVFDKFGINASIVAEDCSSAALIAQLMTRRNWPYGNAFSLNLRAKSKAAIDVCSIEILNSLRVKMAQL